MSSRRPILSVVILALVPAVLLGGDGRDRTTEFGPSASLLSGSVFSDEKTGDASLPAFAACGNVNTVGQLAADDAWAYVTACGASDSLFSGSVFSEGETGDGTMPTFVARGQSPGFVESASRFGWWGVETHGNVNKVGEYQGFDSSAFYDFERLSTDGTRTLDFIISGAESESTQVGIDYFGPSISADIDYQRFIHRLDHDPLTAFDDDGTVPGTYIGYSDDPNAGDDYAIRVQEFDAKFKGRITDNVNWRLNLWGMRKQGEREAMAFSHRQVGCGGTGGCHILNQRQKIDWLTMEIEPVIEARVGPVTVEYSRTMRAFTQDDDIVTRQYGSDRGSRAIRPFDPTGAPYDYEYAVTSPNYTEIDRIKIGADLTENTNFYGNAFIGNTHNRTTSTDRGFNGFDLRVSNRSIDGLDVTAYAKQYNETNQLPSEEVRRELLHLVGAADLSGWTLQPDFDSVVLPLDSYNTDATILDDFLHPTNRTTTTAGVKGRWKPFSSWHDVAVTGGYEYREIERSYATYALRPLFIDDNQVVGGGAVPPLAPNGGSLAGVTHFTQPTTFRNLFRVGLTKRVSTSTDCFVRYKMTQTNDPLFGFTPAVENASGTTTIADALNTNQPMHEDLVEFGGTWTPTRYFLVNATVGLQKRYHNSGYAHFDENDYPITFTAWYSPTPRWSIHGGLAFFSNFIDQEITIGKDHSGFGTAEPLDNLNFAYASRVDLINLGTTYAATDRLTLNGTVEVVRSSAAYGDPSIPTLSIAFLPGASDVLTQTTRVGCGADYEWSPGVNCFCHYNYYQWDDLAGNGETGGVNMFLVGVSAYR